MTRIAAILVLIFLAACSGGAPSPISPQPPPVYQPHADLWLLRDGTWQDNQVLRGTGTFDPTTGCIDVDQKSLVAGEVTRITALAYQMPQGPAVGRVYSPGGVTVTAVPEKLAGALVERSTGLFIGEAANAGATDQDPPEPLLTLSPISGETFTVQSTIRTWDGVTFLFWTRYHTKAVGQDIDGFHGATVTCLVENPDTDHQTAYVQVFDGGDDIAEQLYGPVAADGSVQVTVLRRSATGHN